MLLDLVLLAELLIEWLVMIKAILQPLGAHAQDRINLIQANEVLFFALES